MPQHSAYSSNSETSITDVLRSPLDIVFFTAVSCHCTQTHTLIHYLSRQFRPLATPISLSSSREFCPKRSSWPECE